MSSLLVILNTGISSLPSFEGGMVHGEGFIGSLNCRLTIEPPHRLFVAHCDPRPSVHLSLFTRHAANGALNLKLSLLFSHACLLDRYEMRQTRELAN